MSLRQDARGFSLIEVLIALVIIMIGLLGVAGLQAIGVRSSAQAHLRTLAALDAHSLAASMRANRVYWTDAAAQANVSILASAAGTVTVSPVIATASDCTAMTCTAAETAAYDLVNWGDLLKDMQHGASASITRIAAADAGTSAYAYAVTVSWSERRIKGQGVSAKTETHSTSIVVQP
ncbi:MAG: type IV pilus modification protein PilV [Gammaproteobacteria bacterium]